jgi:hypothetical protein
MLTLVALRQESKELGWITVTPEGMTMLVSLMHE